MRQPDETKKPEAPEAEAPRPGEALPEDALDGAAGGAGDAVELTFGTGKDKKPITNWGKLYG
ncbi:MAG: hypothetical protein IK082_06585 [Oscillospiraceae bacterium]|nr:hypothetical protein [Oscillospiraceae bacterium]